MTGDEVIDDNDDNDDVLNFNGDGQDNEDVLNFDGDEEDDGEFVLDDWEADAADESSTEANLAGAGEEDFLFDDTGLDHDENKLGQSSVFEQDGKEGWGGAGIELDDLGIEMTDESSSTPAHLAADDEGFDLELDDELILIDDDGSLEAAARAPELEPALESAGSAEGTEYDAEEDDAFQNVDFGTKDFEVSEEDDPEWAPISQFDDAEAEVDEEASDEVVYEPVGVGEYEEDPDYSEYEEAYYDDSDVQAPVEHASGSGLRWVVGIAAALFVSAAGALWFYKTDMGATESRVEVIEVIKVDRPSLGVQIEAPTVGSDPVTKDPTTTDPITTDPITTDPITTDPVTTDPVTKDPVTTDPVTKDPGTTDPVTKDPVTTDPVTKDPGTTDPIVKDPAGTDPKPPIVDPNQIQIGDDGMSVSSRDSDIMDRHRRATVEEHETLAMGSQALAQLYNQNIFVGRVKALNADKVTLRTKAGEITLARKDVRALTSLAASEYDVWKDVVSTGFVKLRNDNRLRGKIVEARDDSVVLMVNANRVIIPKSAIESVTASQRDGVQMNSGEDIENDDWFRQLVEKKLQEQDQDKPLDTSSARPVK